MPLTTNHQDRCVQRRSEAKATEDEDNSLTRFHGIPKFQIYADHREQILVHMAAVFRHWARLGFVEGLSGNISVRDPEFPNHIWMNPIGKHFALLNATDMICLNLYSGAIVGGNRSRPASGPGFLIHSEIHRARPTVDAICHAHITAGRSWSVFGRPLDMISLEVCNFHDALVVEKSYTNVASTDEEGRRVSNLLGPTAKGAILVSHGLLTVGCTVSEASYLLGLLDRSCAIQLRVEAARAGSPSLKKKVLTDEIVLKYAATVEKNRKNRLYAEGLPDIEYEIEMAGDRISRGVDKMLVEDRAR